MSNISLMTGFTRIPHVSTSLILQYNALYMPWMKYLRNLKIKHVLFEYAYFTMKENTNGKLW